MTTHFTPGATNQGEPVATNSGSIFSNPVFSAVEQTQDDQLTLTSCRDVDETDQRDKDKGENSPTQHSVTNQQITISQPVAEGGNVISIQTATETSPIHRSAVGHGRIFYSWRKVRGSAHCQNNRSQNSNPGQEGTPV